MTELTYKMLTLPSVFLMEAQIPKEMIDSLNKYLDNLLKKKDRKTVGEANSVIQENSKGFFIIQRPNRRNRKM